MWSPAPGHFTPPQTRLKAPCSEWSKIRRTAFILWQSLMRSKPLNTHTHKHVKCLSFSQAFLLASFEPGWLVLGGCKQTYWRQTGRFLLIALVLWMERHGSIGREFQASCFQSTKFCSQTSLHNHVLILVK